eukprot:14686025-Alexandrium_andersonii.AAC.1
MFGRVWELSLPATPDHAGAVAEAAAGDGWKLLGIVGSCGGLLEAAGDCWELLGAVGSCWGLLEAAGD